MKITLISVKILLFSVIFIPCVFAQQYKLDSLKKEFAKVKDDSLKTEVLGRIAAAAFHVNLDSAIKYNKQQMTFGIKNKRPRSVAYAHRLNGTIYLMKGEYKKAETSYETAISAFKKLNDINYVLSEMHNLSIVYEWTNRHAQSDSLLQATLELALKELPADKQQPLVNMYYSFGKRYSYEGKYISSMEVLMKGLKIAEANNMNNEKVKILMEISTIYLQRKLYNEGIVRLKECLEIAQKDKQLLLLENIYNNLGVAYE
jgi:tetratricopeptide (TPR) repeat protein